MGIIRWAKQWDNPKFEPVGQIPGGLLWRGFGGAPTERTWFVAFKPHGGELMLVGDNLSKSAAYEVCVEASKLETPEAIGAYALLLSSLMASQR